MPGVEDLRTSALTNSDNCPSSESHRRGRPRIRLRPVPQIDPAAKFGPQYRAILNLVSAAEAIDLEKSREIEQLWYHNRGRDRFAARSAASAAASKAGRLVCQIDARQAAWSATPLACRDAAGDAAHALAVRDCIDDSFTQADYDILIKPWAQVLGIDQD